jgi:hypothetical protein
LFKELEIWDLGVGDASATHLQAAAHESLLVVVARRPLDRNSRACSPGAGGGSEYHRHGSLGRGSLGVKLNGDRVGTAA